MLHNTSSLFPCGNNTCTDRNVQGLFAESAVKGIGMRIISLCFLPSRLISHWYFSLTKRTSGFHRWSLDSFVYTTIHRKHHGTCKPMALLFHTHPSAPDVLLPNFSYVCRSHRLYPHPHSHAILVFWLIYRSCHWPYVLILSEPYFNLSVLIRSPLICTLILWAGWLWVSSPLLFLILPSCSLWQSMLASFGARWYRIDILAVNILWLYYVDISLSYFLGKLFISNMVVCFLFQNG